MIIINILVYVILDYFLYTPIIHMCVCVCRCVYVYITQIHVFSTYDSYYKYDLFIYK